MHLETLELKNFRCFSAFKTTFHPSMNVFIGENGAGKTSLVRAVNSAIKIFLSYGGRNSIQNKFIPTEDVQHKTIEYDGVVNERKNYPCNLLLTLKHQSIFWNFNAMLDHENTIEFNPISYNDLIYSYLSSIDHYLIGNNHPDLSFVVPLISTFDPRRTKTYKIDTNKNLSPSTGDTTRQKIQQSFLDDNSLTQEMLQWIYRYTLVGIQRRKPVPQLEAVSQAVCNCIEDAEEFYFDMATLDLAIRTKDNRFVPLPLLSDGYQSMLMMVAEIAWKAAILNPHLGADAAKKTPGIVLIDEVDLHLHPRWQHRVLRDLRTTFPEMQFIVTTHSPQIISTAEAGWLRILDGGEEPRLVEHVQGWDSNAVLEQIMGAHHRPPETQEKLNALFTAIADEDFPKAKALLDQLERQMGHSETELVHARLTMQDLPMDADHEKNPEVP